MIVNTGEQVNMRGPPSLRLSLSVLDFALQPREEAHVVKLSSCAVQCYRTVFLSDRVQLAHVHRRE